MLPMYESKASDRLWSYIFEDFSDGLRRRNVWYQLILRDVRNKSNGAKLGVLWVILAQAFATAGIGLVYSELFDLSLQDYLPYLAIGLITWSFMVTMITEAPNCFTSNRAYLLQSRLPMSLCAFRLVGRNTILFLLKCSIVVLVLVLFQVPQSWASLIVIPGMVAICVAGLLTAITFGYINAIYRDFGQLVTSTTLFMFFLTPIFWRADRLGSYAWVVDWNPLYHLLSLIRQPLLGETVELWTYFMVFVLLCLLGLASFLSYWVWGRRVLYWL